MNLKKQSRWLLGPCHQREAFLGTMLQRGSRDARHFIHTCLTKCGHLALLPHSFVHTVYHEIRPSELHAFYYYESDLL